MKPLVTSLACLALLASGSAHAQDAPAWSLEVGKTEADLRLAAPGGEDQPLALHCLRKSGQIVVRFDVERRLADRLQGQTWVDSQGRPAPWPVSITLASGPARTTLPGRARADEMHGGSSVEVEASDAAPVIGQFGKTGMLTVEALGETVRQPAAPRAMATRLLRSCRR